MPPCRRLLLLLLLLLSASSAQEDDVRCLRSVKSALSDPTGSLSWNFANTTVGFVCNFTGVSCWDPQKNRVLGLTLTSMSLSGPIPSALQFCHAATSLELSGNSLSGPVPSNLCDWLPYLVTLDLSNNSLTGPIPPDLSRCQYLNTLILSNNHLTGAIPPSLSRHARLHSLDLSDNHLVGPIPASLASFDERGFAGNSALCGRPLSSCGGSGLSRTSLIIILAAGILGAAAPLLAYAVWRWYRQRYLCQ